MKKLIFFDYIIILGVILVIIIAVLVYFKSDKYEYKIAKIARDEKLQELNKIPKWCIPTGVYSFDCYVDKITSDRDKFGQSNLSRSSFYTGKGEVSFTYSSQRGQKFVIIANGMREEINLGDVKVMAYEDMTTYTFDLLNWEVQDLDTNRPSFKYDTSGLSMGKVFKENAYLLVYSNTKKDAPYIGLSTLGFPFFKCNNSYSIQLENLEYKYDDINPFEYSDKAKFSLPNGKDVYDIKTYLPQRSR